MGGANYAGVTNYVNTVKYRAFDAPKSMNFSNGRTFEAGYDSRMRPTTWKVLNVLGYDYDYDLFNERTGRVSYAHSLYDPTLHRSYEYDHAGRLAVTHTGAQAQAHVGVEPWGAADGPFAHMYEYDVWGNLTRRFGWGGEAQGGSPSSATDLTYSYTNNRRGGSSYDAAGNLTNDGGQSFLYDATGQQTSAAYAGYGLQQGYDGDGLRVRKDENGDVTYYLRSSVLGGQVVCEFKHTPWWGWYWNRGYVYLGGRLLAVQKDGVSFVHEDPVTKSKRVTDMSGAVVSAVETDPFGADTSRSSNAAFQPRKYTSYERDQNGTDEAMFRRYNRRHARFDQPDPYDGSYDLTDPQSLNRYPYVTNDPVNFVDPTGLWGMSELGFRPRSTKPPTASDCF